MKQSNQVSSIGLLTHCHIFSTTLKLQNAAVNMREAVVPCYFNMEPRLKCKNIAKSVPVPARPIYMT